MEEGQLLISLSGQRSKRKEKNETKKKVTSRNVWGKNSDIAVTLQNTSNVLCYLIVCPLKLFYTFQCGQSDKEHSDPVEIPLVQHF